jgi:hypothetical protein
MACSGTALLFFYFRISVLFVYLSAHHRSVIRGTAHHRSGVRGTAHHRSVIRGTAHHHSVIRGTVHHSTGRRAALNVATSPLAGCRHSSIDEWKVFPKCILFLISSLCPQIPTSSKHNWPQYECTASAATCSLSPCVFHFKSHHACSPSSNTTCTPWECKKKAVTVRFLFEINERISTKFSNGGIWFLSVCWIPTSHEARWQKLYVPQHTGLVTSRL